MHDSTEKRTPPDAARVAARAIVLSAITCRGMLDFDDDKREAEERRRAMCGWLEGIGAANELEENEHSLVRTPIGQLDQQDLIDAMWRSEGMLVLAWSLARLELPRYDEPCDSFGVALQLGFLRERSATALERPLLRPREEIERRANTYLTVHWRLRQHSIHPRLMELVNQVSGCTWGSLAEVDLIDGDLDVGGKRIDRIGEDLLHRTMSIARERHKAFNWLLGFEPVYSKVATHT